MANETIVINDDLRTMQIPSSIVLLGVESDDDVNKLPFQMPKEYCGFDLSQFEARINYMNANGVGDLYIVDDLEVDGDDPSLMNFTWLVGRNACAYKGNTKFIVCLKKFDDKQNVVQEFNTTVYSLPVLEGLETTEAVVQQNADIIEYILQKIEEAGSIDLSNYYTKPEVNALKLANPYALTLNGTEYDGSEPVEIEIQGASQTTETVDGTILHVTDAVPNTPVKSLNLYDENGDEISSATICITNKNLFRLDQIATQTVSKGVTFTKNSDGSITATGTTTGTYAATQCEIDASAFVVGQTYTISSGKTGGSLYVQLIVNYTDNTTDYLVANSTPYVFSVAKPIASVIGSVQITNSGVTVNERIYPMVELADSASIFTDNMYSTLTFDGSTMPVLPASISNLWSTDSTVDNIVMEYWNDPLLAQVNELEKQFQVQIQHDDALDSTSEHAVQNKVVTAALLTKVNAVTGKGLSTNDFTDDHKTKVESISYVTPEMFGAKGDGTTDDTLALQTAVNNGEMVILKNHYLISEPIILKDNSKLYGVGDAYIDKYIQESGYPAIYAEDKEGILIEGITIYGTWQWTGGSISGYNNDFGIRLNDCNKCIVSKNHVYQCGACSISIIGNDNTISENFINYDGTFTGGVPNYNFGIEYDGENFIIIGNEISGVIQGIISGLTNKNVIISNNNISTKGQHGLYMEGANHVIVSNNIIHDCTICGIKFQRDENATVFEDIVIIGNTIYNCGGQGVFVIALSDCIYDVNVSNNNISKCARCAHLEFVIRGIFAGNVLNNKSTANYGLFMLGCDDLTISNNRIYVMNVVAVLFNDFNGNAPNNNIKFSDNYIFLTATSLVGIQAIYAAYGKNLIISGNYIIADDNSDYMGSADGVYFPNTESSINKGYLMNNVVLGFRWDFRVLNSTNIVFENNHYNTKTGI